MQSANNSRDGYSVAGVNVGVSFIHADEGRTAVQRYAELHVHGVEMRSMGGSNG